jgi:hypothetical protein
VALTVFSAKSGVIPTPFWSLDNTNTGLLECLSGKSGVIRPRADALLSLDNTKSSYFEPRR